MSGVDNVNVECSSCGFIFQGDEVGKHPHEAKPCPNCGSVKRHIRLTINDSVSVRDYIKGEVRRPDSKHKNNRADHEFEEGKTVGRDGRPVLKTRVIDRGHPDSDDSYQELVIDEATGNTIVDKHERLSEHT